MLPGEHLQDYIRVLSVCTRLQCNQSQHYLWETLWEGLWGGLQSNPAMDIVKC